MKGLIKSPFKKTAAFKNYSEFFLFIPDIFMTFNSNRKLL